MVQEIKEAGDRLGVSELDMMQKETSPSKCLETSSAPERSYCQKQKCLRVGKKYAALQQLLCKMEQYTWQSTTHTTALIGTISGPEQSCDRDCAVSSIRCLNIFYGFNSETFASAVCFLDRFLTKIKVQLKYLPCVAAACFYIASKLHQEPEEFPSASELCFLHRQSWTASDLKRMELVILEKLNWELWPVTCPRVIKTICDILSETQLLPDSCTSLSDTLYKKFEICINYKLCAIYKPTTLALCLIDLELRKTNLLTPGLQHQLLNLQEQLKIYDSEFHDCLETVGGILNNYANRTQSQPAGLYLPKPQPRMSLCSRPSYYGCTGLPTIDEVESLDAVSREQTTADSDDEVFYDCIKKNRSWSYCLLPERFQKVCDIN